MVTGQDIVNEAKKHLDEPYKYGANVPFEDPNYKGPWDCAEFCSWVVYQVSKIVIGCCNNKALISALEPFSDSWFRDGSTSKKNGFQYKTTPGAVLVRKKTDEKCGHVAFILDDNNTIEAMDSQHGVTSGKVNGRNWDICFLIDGINYYKS